MKTEENSNGRFVLRAVVVWFVIIAAESVHGTLRVIFLEPLVGDFRARQIAIFTAMLIIFGITYLFVGWLRAGSRKRLLAAGTAWLILSLIFEISLGRLVGFSWARIFADYNLTRGGLMPLGLVFIVFAPLLATKLRGEKNVLIPPAD